MRITITIVAHVTSTIARVYIDNMTDDRLRDMIQTKAPAGVRVELATIEKDDG